MEIDLRCNETFVSYDPTQWDYVRKMLSNATREYIKMHALIEQFNEKTTDYYYSELLIQEFEINKASNIHAGLLGSTNPYHIRIYNGLVAFGLNGLQILYGHDFTQYDSFSVGQCHDILTLIQTVETFFVRVCENDGDGIENLRKLKQILRECVQTRTVMSIY